MYLDNLEYNMITPIREPEIYAMIGMGLGLLGWLGRQTRRGVYNIRDY